MNQKTQTITLGSTYELHTGIHDSLYCQPPKGFRYQRRQARHYYLINSKKINPQKFNPFLHFHDLECVQFSGAPGLVHSAQWPVINCSAWVCDLSSSLYFLLGKHCFSPAGRKLFGRRNQSHAFEQIKKRFSLYLTMLSHPSCLGIICRTHRHVNILFKSMVFFGLGHKFRSLKSKFHVIYPTHPACDWKVIQKKWENPQKFKITFCGRAFERKNGALALTIFSTLLKKYKNLECFVYSTSQVLIMISETGYCSRCMEHRCEEGLLLYLKKWFICHLDLKLMKEHLKIFQVVNG